MENVDLTQSAIVFWIRSPNLQPGVVTRFDRLDDAVRSVMQHSSAPVAWIKTMDRHLDMDEIRSIARHSGLVSYLSRSEHEMNASVKDAGTKPRSLMRRLICAARSRPTADLSTDCISEAGMSAPGHSTDIS